MCALECVWWVGVGCMCVGWCMCVMGGYRGAGVCGGCRLDYSKAGRGL